MTVAFILLGLYWAIFLGSIYKACRIFPHKQKPFFLILVSGLCGAIVYGTLSIAVFQFDAPLVLYTYPGILGWYIMILCCNEIYVRRITSLGLQGGKVVGWVRYCFLVLMTPIVVLIWLTPFFSNPTVVFVSFVLAVTLSACIAVAELFLFAVLVQKVVEILEYRAPVRKKLLVELVIGVTVLVGLECAVFVAKFFPDKIDRFLRPLVYLLRFAFVIRFYDDLFEGLI